MILRLPAFLWASAVILSAQTPFPLREIDNVADLFNGESDRAQAELGLARARTDEENNLLFEGADDSGRPWIMRFESNYSGIAVRVFRGDLDRSGRDDLLIVRVAYGNGRCIDQGEVTTLMFDERGIPTPWQAHTVGLLRDADPPMTVLDVDADGRAEIIVTECEYAEQMSERRWIQGVYEADGRRWVPLNVSSREPYERAAWDHVAEFLSWTDGNVFDRSKQPAEWPDLEAGRDAVADLAVDGLLSEDYGCEPYGFAEREPEPGEPECTYESRGSAFRLSDGSIRRSNPDAVFNSPDLLDIRFDQDPGRLRHFLAAGYTFRAIGPKEKPWLFWVDSADDRATAPLKTELSVTFEREIPIRLEAKPGADTEPTHYFSVELIAPRPVAAPVANASPGTSSANIPPRGYYFGRQGRCFRFQGYDVDDLGWFEPVDNCAELIPETANVSDQEVFLHEGGMDPLLVLSPAARTLTAPSQVDRGPMQLDRHQDVTFEEIAGAPGELVAAVRFEHDSYLTQWRLGTRTWLGMHNIEGKALWPAIDIQTEGELFHVDDRVGLVFVVWEDGLPVDAKLLRGRFEVVRAE